MKIIPRRVIEIAINSTKTIICGQFLVAYLSTFMEVNFSHSIAISISLSLSLFLARTLVKMEDAGLEEIRKQRMAEMQAQQGAGSGQNKQMEQQARFSVFNIPKYLVDL